MSSNTDPRPKLIYVGDPMCSWCYGIGQNLEDVMEKYSDKLDYELVMGGLRPYNTQSMSELKSFLTHHWEDVNKASGQVFTYGILDDTQITYDTEPPCRATVIARDMAPLQAFKFFKCTQEAFYQDNKNMHLVESYHSILDELKMDKEEFTKRFHSAEMKEKVKLDFAKSSSMGVSSFPTIILEYKGQYHLIAKGFATVDQMSERIEVVVK
jgi:putative protein-disulfide isomerase